MYIYDHSDWSRLHWRNDRLIKTLAAVRYQQGRLIGQMEALGFDLRQEATFETLIEDVLKTSDIEGERLDAGQVRSSVARHLGLDIGGPTNADRKIEGISGHRLRDITDMVRRGLLVRNPGGGRSTSYSLADPL